MSTLRRTARATVAPAIEHARARDVQFQEDMLLVRMEDGRALMVPLAWYPRLAQATPLERGHWELIGRGVGIHWPDIDEDLSVACMLGDHE